MTRWAKKIDPQNVWPEYPRPMLVRSEWKNLNGLWEYAIESKDAQKPAQFQGQILVPFAAESALSGVGKAVGAKNNLWYRRSFTVPQDWKGKRVLLNFEAVDWESTVWVNGKEIGTHRGGYDPFSYDITDALNSNREQELVVKVWDPTNDENAPQPRGKQVMHPGGIFYTAVTGIWQTVWLEPVPQTHIESLKIVPDVNNRQVIVTVNAKNAENCEAVVTAKFDNISSSAFGPAGKPIRVENVSAKLWTPDSPNLYDLEVKLIDKNKKPIDTVSSYFGMRKSTIAKDEAGIMRMMLNGKFVFQLGPLDQGWWPDGLYTAPSDEALRYDLEVLKKLGFNMLRKHVKSEPRRLYYWCDKLGLMVWQDMPSSDFDRNRYSPEKLQEIDKQWETELKNLIDTLHNHPSIIMWVAFNEGWGQHDTERITKWIKQYDPTRLVDNASGWTDRKVGDVMDIHNYPGPAMPRLEPNRAVVLGEFGGLGLPLKGHLWQEEGNWGYRSYEGLEQYAISYTNLIQRLYPLVTKGLSAAVYTQTSDCEIEVNGLMTYDREIIKIDPNEFSSLNRGYLPPKFSMAKEVFIDQADIELVSDDAKAQIHYTLDGSVPTKNSPIYKGAITIKDNATIKARSFWPDGEKSIVVSKSVKKTQPAKAAAGLSEVKEPGIKFDYFQGRWEKLPDFSKLQPAKSGIAQTMDLGAVNEKENYALRFTGFIKIAKQGVYSFYCDSDDGTKLSVAGKEVVVNDGVHGMLEVKGDISLGEGWHPIEFLFFQGGGGQGLRVSYDGPGIEKGIIPADVLAH